jgi:uncharacterized membrane protein YdjX (TVP38/TMEM64 family)
LAKSTNKRAIQILAIIFLIVLIAVLTYFLANVGAQDLFNQIRPFIYPGIFLLCLTCSLTVIFPVPGELVLLLAGAAGVSYWWGGLVASIGGTLGEISGYFLGYWGRAAVPEKALERYARIEQWMKRYGSPMVFIFAITPLPFDLLGIAAGHLRFPLWKFYLACWLGRLPREIFIIWLGSLGYASVPSSWVWGAVGGGIIMLVVIITVIMLRRRRNRG